MKHLAEMGVITETGPDQYHANGLSTVLAVERFSGAFSPM